MNHIRELNTKTLSSIQTTYLVFGQLIDFERQNNFVFEDIAALKFLLYAFDDRARSFIIGNEPDRKSFSKES